MPKTSEAKTENSTAAVKWESSGSFGFSDHASFRWRCVGVGRADEVQQSGDDQKLGAIIAVALGYCAMPSPAAGTM